MPTYRLTTRGTIYRRTGVINDFARGGDPKSEPQKVVDTWANFRALVGTEKVVANQIYPTASYRAVIRWPGVGISSDMNLVVQERTFEILGIVEIEDQYLELTLTETGPVGEVALR